MHQNLTLIVRDGWNQRVPGWRDLFAILLVLTVVILLGSGARQMLQPFAVAHQPEISLSVSALPNYALRTIMRMLAALLASLLFTFLYATLAAKSRRAEMVLIPILDVLQSVPVLGYLSFTTVFFIALFPGNVMGPELAAIFAIFTSQAWNMTFSFYESLRMIPNDLDEASRSFRFSGWQRFWRLEVPFAMPGLIWNMMMSMSGGWFFVVASEAITVGTLQVTLPGIGSYVATAIAHRDLQAIGWAIVAMSITILMYDQLLFRPLVAWSEKFRFEQTTAQDNAKSWLISLIRSTRFLHPLAAHFTHALQRVGRARLSWIDKIPALTRPTGSRRIVDRLWHTSVLLGLAYGLWILLHYFKNEVSMNESDRRVAGGFIDIHPGHYPDHHRQLNLGTDWCRCWTPAALDANRTTICTVSGGISSESDVSDRSLSNPALQRQSTCLVITIDDTWNAMVYLVQCDCRRIGLSE